MKTNSSKLQNPPYQSQLDGSHMADQLSISPSPTPLMASHPKGLSKLEVRSQILHSHCKLDQIIRFKMSSVDPLQIACKTTESLKFY